MDFEKICMMFTMQEPFYGIILSSMTRQPTNQVSTLGVRRNGTVFSLGYNPDFVDKLSLDSLMEILKHETLHIALNHFSIWDEESINPNINQLRNIAEDLEINCYLDRNKLDSGAKGVFAEDFGFQKNLGAREYFNLLSKKLDDEQKKQKANAKNPSKPCNGGQGGQGNQSSQNSNGNQNGNQQGQGQQTQSGNGQQGQGQPQGQGQGSGQGQNQGQSQGKSIGSGAGNTGTFLDDVNRFDDHSQWPNGMTNTEKEELEQAVDDILVMAAEETEKTCGSVPAFIQQRLEKIKSRRPKPVTDWKRHFRRYIGNQFTDLRKKSHKRPSKRFPESPGKRHQRKSHVLVGIDTSGSINMREYNEFMGQLMTLSEKATFRVLECDSKIQYEYDFNGKIPQTVHGGGGTEFYPVINYFLENRKKYDALVYFTDGYGYIPNNTPKETLWVICTSGDRNKKKYQVNGATAVLIKHNK